ncbi:hypothetical protein SHJG_2061 [Streptomyces hygroscopicus subsp. jinggangensis 5008]|nr:hypothetical protein SHJG_2061 [Streptomyces hygroscopicus subsp. jinggangensis 5008]AGF61492.1 hypothetical protein SHJGH_1826 [Streptomyces hygroscopicus subsp. jinggangensis TL01]
MTDPATAPASATYPPHPARVRNHWLGGTDTCPVDARAGDAYAAGFPGIARGSRAFLRRTITHRGREAGVRQFLDVGTGLPTAGNTHEVTQRLAPESRIVYVGDDPMLPAPARTLLRSSPRARPPASTPTPPTRTASSPPPRRPWTRPGRPGSSPATSWAMSPATTRPAPSSTG